MNNPIAIRQAWIWIRQNGKQGAPGYSYHRTEEDLRAFVAAYLSTASPVDLDVEGLFEDPFGDPERVTVTESFYALICSSAHGIWV